EWCAASCELEPKHRFDGTQRYLRLVEPRLTRGEPLQPQPGQQENAPPATRRALDEAPELHRQGKREQEDDHGRPHRGADRQQPVRTERDGQCERREVRAAPRGEPRRAGGTLPRRLEPPRFGSGDGTVLRAVKVERSTAEDRRDEQQRERDARARRARSLEQGETERRDQSGQYQPALAPLRDAVAPEERFE